MTDQVENGSINQVILDLTQAGAANQKQFRVRVNGVSMKPALRMGDVLVAESVPPEALRCGDILVIRRPFDLVTHRLIQIAPPAWRTKGDRSWQADPEVTTDMILGRVVAIERGQRRIDLQLGRWPWVNRILGQAGTIETRLHRGKIGGAMAENANWLARLMNRMIGWPFRVLNILLTI